MTNTMTEKEISDSLVRWLEPYGIIKWHKNSNHSFYLKFRDVRLGSIRIANHKGRERYRYTYELYRKDKDIERKIDDVIQSIRAKSDTLKGFDPQKFIVWDKANGGYKEVKDFAEYKLSIWGK